MRNMNVLEVVEACGGGVGRHVRILCEGLVERGHGVTVAYSPHRTDQIFTRFMDDYRGEISFVPLKSPRRVSPAADLSSAIRLMRLIRSEGPFDVVHGHSAKGGALARLAGRPFGIPTVYTPHSLIASSPKISTAEAAVYTAMERFLGHALTSKIIAVSADERDFILKLKLAPEERVTAIENGIEDEHFASFSADNGNGAGNRPLNFGSLMRFTPQKAPGHLIDAFGRLSAALPQVPMQLILAGDGELFDEAKKQVEAAGLSDKVRLLGWRTDIMEVMRMLDVFVMSSLYEDGPYAIMEAMTARLPVVTTDVFGAEDKTAARVPGNVVVPVGDPESLASGMRRMATLSAPGSLRRSLRRVGQANYDYAYAHFKQSDSTRRTLELYESLLERTLEPVMNLRRERRSPGAGIRQANATKCNPAKVSGSLS